MAAINRRNFMTATASLAASGVALGADWNQWRGPNRNGAVGGDFPWPAEIAGNHLTELWRVPLQPSYSGPIVSNGNVFVTETLEKKAEATTALSLETGELLWKQQWTGAMSVPFFARSNGSWIRSTPAVSNNRLLIGGIRDVLVCLDADRGEELWRNDFVASQKSPLPSFGMVCSPLIDGDFAYVQAGGGLLKVDLETGNVVWRSMTDGGGMYGSAFSSPILAELRGVKQLLVQTRTKLGGVDPETGDELWSTDIPAFRGMNIVPPTVFEDSVFTSSYGGGSFCFDISNAGGWSATEKWSNKVQGYMSSPMLFGSHVYLHLKNQRFSCMDLATGKQKWSSRPYGKYWSCVAQGDRILALDERGDLFLVQPNPDAFTLVDQRKVASNSWAHLAVVDDLVLVRDLTAMIVYRWT